VTEPFIARTTYKSIIWSYSRLVEQGLSDTDLTKRQRQFVHIMLNLASNTPVATRELPIADDTRDQVVRRLSDINDNALWLVRIANSKAEDDFRAAWERTIAILRGV
jgi:hypothetical protein